MLVPLRACHEASKYLLKRMKHTLDKELASTIHITNQLLRYHIHDLLDQSVISNNGFKAMFEKASISKAIGEIILMIQQMINEKNLQIQLIEAKKYCDCLFDKKRLQQVLLNVLMNSIEHQWSGIIRVFSNVIEVEGE